MPQITIQQAFSEAQKWMTLKGVAGLAIGKKGSKDCIVVYTEMPVPALPRRFHGFAVVVEMGDPFNALKTGLPG